MTNSLVKKEKNMQILKVSNLKKVYTSKLGTHKVEALKDVSFTANKGEFIAIMGESGSGKTTLLNILAALDQPTYGEVLVADTNLSKVKDKELSDFRRESLGFVFQDFNLLDTLTAEENIILPLVLSKKKAEDIKKALQEVTGKLGISDLIKKYPYELSGGQKQRVAVARGIVTRPVMLLADEPTGALDSKSTDVLLNEFKSVNQEGQTVLMVTHSIKAASVASRVLFIKDGVIFHELYKGDSKDNEFYQKISDSLIFLEKAGE